MWLFKSIVQPGFSEFFLHQPVHIIKFRKLDHLVA